LMFEPKKSREPNDNAVDASKLASDIMTISNAASMLWELDFSRNLYGAGVLRVSPTMTFPHVKWSHFPIDGFYPVFNPSDPDELVECYAISVLTEEQVRTIYGIDPTTLPTIPLPIGIPGRYYVKAEHWTKRKYDTTINNVPLQGFSGVNPWGIIPFVYIPRIRTIDWSGEALVEDIYRPQDELNMRIGDIADALNYNSHPTRWGKNLPDTFNAQNFPLGANSFWDLGRKFGDSSEGPEIGMLQADQPVPETAFTYIRFIYDWARVSSSAPPIAFGEDSGGGQRSGVTLEIRLWPLIKAVKRSRNYMATGLRTALNISGRILAQKKFSDIDPGIVQTILEGGIVPVFYRILPRDQAQVVDEVVKLMTCDPPAISLETAQTILGRGAAELIRIDDTIKLREAIAKREAEMMKEFAPKPAVPAKPAPKPAPKE